MDKQVWGKRIREFEKEHAVSGQYAINWGNVLVNTAHDRCSRIRIKQRGDHIMKLSTEFISCLMASSNLERDVIALNYAREPIIDEPNVQNFMVIERKFRELVNITNDMLYITSFDKTFITDVGAPVNSLIKSLTMQYCPFTSSMCDIREPLGAANAVFTKVDDYTCAQLIMAYDNVINSMLTFNQVASVDKSYSYIRMLMEKPANRRAKDLPDEFIAMLTGDDLRNLVDEYRNAFARSQLIDRSNIHAKWPNVYVNEKHSMTDLIDQMEEEWREKFDKQKEIKNNG